MVPRADIVAVQKDIALGELLKVFATPGAFAAGRLRRHARRRHRHGPHPRPHRAHDGARGGGRSAGRRARSRCRPASISRRSISRCRCRPPSSCARSCSRRPRCRCSTCSPRCRRPASISRSWSTNTAAPTASSRSRTSSSRSSARSPTSTTRTSLRAWCARPTAPSSPTRARASRTSTAIIGPEFDVGEVAKEVDTLAGYIATRIGRVPVRGEVVPGPGRFEIEVLDADPRRVKKLKIYQSPDRPGTARPRPPDHLPGHQPAPRRVAGAVRRPASNRHVRFPKASTSECRRSKAARSQTIASAPCFRSSCQRVLRRITNFGNGANRDLRTPRPFDRAVVGMAAHPDRVCGRRRDRAGAAAAHPSGRCRFSPFRCWSG